MGSGIPSWGTLIPGIRERLAARKSQYLKKPKRSRLKIALWATNHRAFLSSARYFSTSSPWVKSMRVERIIIRI